MKQSGPAACYQQTTSPDHQEGELHGSFAQPTAGSEFQQTSNQQERRAHHTRFRCTCAYAVGPSRNRGRRRLGTPHAKATARESRLETLGLHLWGWFHDPECVEMVGGRWRFVCIPESHWK